jgi:XisI protein
MDRLDTYRQIIRSVLKPYTQIVYANVKVQNRQVLDRETDRYGRS